MGDATFGDGSKVPWAGCRQLCWEDGWAAGGGQEAAGTQQPSLVLGADLLYDPGVIPVLLALLRQVLAAAPAQEDGSNVEMQQQQPAAYIATTLRNEATLHQFLVAAESDPAIYIQQLAGPAARSSAGKAAAAGGVEEGAAGRDGGCDASRGGSSPAIRFQHVPELEAARSRIFLHRITLAP